MPLAAGGAARVLRGGAVGTTPGIGCCGATETDGAGDGGDGAAVPI